MTAWPSLASSTGSSAGSASAPSLLPLGPRPKPMPPTLLPQPRAPGPGFQPPSRTPSPQPCLRPGRAPSATSPGVPSPRLPSPMGIVLLSVVLLRLTQRSHTLQTLSPGVGVKSGKEDPHPSPAPPELPTTLHFCPSVLPSMPSLDPRGFAGPTLVASAPDPHGRLVVPLAFLSPASSLDSSAPPVPSKGSLWAPSALLGLLWGLCLWQSPAPD